MSIDIDLSYIGEVVYEGLADVRERTLAEVRKCAEQLGYSPSYGKGQQAGRTIRLPYDSGQVKVDVNFMNRVTLFDEVELKSSIDPSMSFKTLSPYDLFGGKVRALLGRATVRDLYDIKTMFEGLEKYGSKPKAARRPTPRASHQESCLEKHGAQSRTRNLSTQQGKGLGPKGR